MTPIEANLILTTAALLDPRMKRTDPADQADMATMWAEVLTDAGVEVAAAVAAVKQHYAVSRESIMTADLVAACGGVADPQVVDVTGEYLELAKARDLAAIGITVDEYDNDPTMRAEADIRLDALALERLVSE